jgi:prephenate dehydratase
MKKNSKIVIPESNRITGNIGIEYLIFKYRLNIYSEHFQKIEHNLLGQKGAKLADIKNVFLTHKLYRNVQNFIKKNNLNEHVRADTAGSAEMISKIKKKMKLQLPLH